MKAVLVICEGRHDVVFVQRSLGAVADCRWMEERIKELPSPFGTIPGTSEKGLIAQRIERDVDDLTLRSAEYPPLPQFHSPVFDESADIIFLPVRANGKTQVAAVIDLLEDVDASMGVGGVYVSEYAVAFLFDADAIGRTATLEAFRDGYGEHFGGLSDAPTLEVGGHGYLPGRRVRLPQDGRQTRRVRSKITWHRWSSPPGPTRYPDARGFIDGNREALRRSASRNDATRLKAIITSAGQFDHPGSPLSTMIARHGIPQEQFADVSDEPSAGRLPSEECLGVIINLRHLPPDEERHGPKTRCEAKRCASGKSVIGA